MTDLKLDKFSGPLDLLLQLIENQELDITEISLSQITEQYFFYLNKLERDRPENLADFLVIATKLIYLKSKNLLPYLYPEEEEQGPSLADQLKMYKAYVEASKNIFDLWDRNMVAYGRTEPPVRIAEFVVPINARPDDLLNCFQSLLKRLKPIKPLPEVTIDYSISVKQAMDNIRNLLKNKSCLSFKNLLSKAGTRTEIIVNFLALLELVGKKTAAVKQVTAYGDLELQRV